MSGDEVYIEPQIIPVEGGFEYTVTLSRGDSQWTSPQMRAASKTLPAVRDEVAKTITLFRDVLLGQDTRPVICTGVDVLAIDVAITGIRLGHLIVSEHRFSSRGTGTLGVAFVHRVLALFQDDDHRIRWVLDCTGAVYNGYDRGSGLPVLLTRGPGYGT